VLDVYPVKDSIRSGAHLDSMEDYERMYRRSLENPEEFWAEQAQILDWFRPWDRVVDADFAEVDFGWFLGGKLNA